MKSKKLPPLTDENLTHIKFLLSYSKDIDYIYGQQLVKRVETLQIDLDEALEAIRGLFKASDEIAVEFIQNKRATNWAVVNEAYCRAEECLKKHNIPKEPRP